MRKLLPVLGLIGLTSLFGPATAVHAQPGGTQPAPAPAPTGAPAQPGQVPPATPAPHPVNTAPITLDQKDMDELKDVEQEFDNFTKAATEHQARMRTIAKREFDTRSGDLDRRYGDRIARTEADRGKRHADTIALLVKFLANHPSHDVFTPDAMFRLADLYLDQSDEEVESRRAATEGSNGQPQAGSAGDAPIVADYSKSLDLWEKILTQFPSYRQTPSTLYLYAYYTKQSKPGEERKALEAFLALTCANHYKWDAQPPPLPTREQAIKRVEAKTLRDPYADCTPYAGSDPELVRHAWVRGIADYHFLVPGELDEAIAAYLKVADGGNESKLYAESLYKLAWSYYKRDFLEDSIKRFDQSVKLYDSIIAAGNQPPLELRDESIQYIAVALTDPWPGEADTDPVKAFERASKMYKGRENEPHVRDVWVALGHAFSELQAWDQAVDSYRLAIGPPWELDPHNPVVHQEIVNVYEAKGDKFAADQAAAELATKYAPGTPWYTANEKDREAMENQRRIAERALYAAAVNTNTAAKVQREDYEAGGKKDAAMKDGYIALYTKAFQLYKQFLDTYRDSDYVYEFNFKMGDALYYSERYLDAAQQYRWVRDHQDIGKTHYVDAARAVVSSLQSEADRQVAAGRLAPLKVPSADELKTLLGGGTAFTPQPIPDVYAQLQSEFDNYQQHVNDPNEAPHQGINAALISLAYLHIDDAVRRLQSVMDQFCKAAPADPKDPKSLPYSATAKDGLLAIYEATGNLDAVEQTNNAYIQKQCGTPQSIDIAISQNRSLNFQRASKLFDQKHYIEAADAFYKFYKTAPTKDPDLPSALYSSAVSYFLGERPKTAISLFKEFTANPDKAYRDSPYYLDAMRLTAASYQASFDYDNAVSTYLTLYDTTRKAKARGIKPPPPLPGQKPISLDEMGLTALFNAAFAAELNRDYNKAIDLYTTYQGVEPDTRKKDRALWEVAGIYRQAGDIGSMTDTLDRWRARYGRSPDNVDDFVESYYDTAAAWQKKGRTSQAIASGADTVTAWKRVGSPTKGKAAKMAGEWALADIEAQFHARWEPYAITTAANTINQATAQKAAISKLRDDFEAKYKTLGDFGVAEYTMASLVRFGDLEVRLALKLGAAPMPTAGGQNSCNTNPDICRSTRTRSTRTSRRTSTPRRGRGKRSTTPPRRLESPTSGASWRGRSSLASSPTSTGHSTRRSSRGRIRHDVRSKREVARAFPVHGASVDRCSLEPPARGVWRERQEGDHDAAGRLGLVVLRRHAVDVVDDGSQCDDVRDRRRRNGAKQQRRHGVEQPSGHADATVRAADRATEPRPRPQPGEVTGRPAPRRRQAVPQRLAARRGRCVARGQAGARDRRYKCRRRGDGRVRLLPQAPVRHRRDRARRRVQTRCSEEERRHLLRLRAGLRPHQPARAGAAVVPDRRPARPQLRERARQPRRAPAAEQAVQRGDGDVREADRLAQARRRRDVDLTRFGVSRQVGRPAVGRLAARQADPERRGGLQEGARHQPRLRPGLLQPRPAVPRQRSVSGRRQPDRSRQHGEAVLRSVQDIEGLRCQALRRAGEGREQAAQAPAEEAGKGREVAMRKVIQGMCALALAAGTLAATRVARAEGCEEQDTSDKKAGKFHIVMENGKPVTVIDTIVSVCGKVPRPSVVYVLTVKNIDYEWENLKQDFMPLILQTVKKAPF